MVEGARRSTLKELAEWTAAADKGAGVLKLGFGSIGPLPMHS